MSEQQTPVDDRRNAKRDAIHAAAISQFTGRGYAGTSMANIADAAGMSRPALYQYFRDKDDIFASAFVALFEHHVVQALEALSEPHTVNQLDGFLQRFDGDIWETMAESPHTDEIISAKSGEVATAVAAVVMRLWNGMRSHLEQYSTDTALVDEWVDILRMSPKGLKSDHPPVATYRRRLSTLARSVAADIDAATTK